MSLLDTFLLEAPRSQVWLSLRTDGIQGDGSAGSPYNGGLLRARSMPVSLEKSGNEVTANSGSSLHGFSDGSIVEIQGVTGDGAMHWNRAFTVYGIEPTKFKFALITPFAPEGSPFAALVTFQFDRILRDLPSNTRINLGPGTFQTRGYAPQGINSWQPKAGQNIVGAGIGVTTLQLVGASVADQHYHAIGVNLSPSGATPAAPVGGFEISDLTIDCNMDNQPLRGQSNYTPVACGAVRVFGSHCRIRNVKAINWDTKSLKEGCFVLSIIDASTETTDGNGQPVMQESTASGIEDCIAVAPSRNCTREVTVLHVGGKKNAANQAQAFGVAPFIRNNFVDGEFKTPPTAVPPSQPSNSHLLTSGSGTSVYQDDPNYGFFASKRRHFRVEGEWVRFSNPRDPASRWNGYFSVIINDEYSLFADLAGAQGTTDDSSQVIMGAEIRGIAVTSCVGAVVEGNQIHNCWIGGPYAGPLDDSVSQPTVPPTLAREERLDSLNTLNIRSLIVRNNFYRNVAAGPYWNMGGVSGTVSGNSINYAAATGIVTVTTAKNHHLWLGARVKIESAPNTAYEGIREISEITNATTFKYVIASGLTGISSGTGSYRVVSGVDFLTIDGNTISLADLDETEFGPKEYPLASGMAAQTYRAFGIVIGDNELSAAGGPYAHRQVLICNNRIRYVDGQRAATVAGLGTPSGAAMQLTGIKELHVTRNVVDLNASKKLLAFRCGMVRLFHNTLPGGEFVTSWPLFVQTYHDDPVSVAEDAFILSMFDART